MTSRERIKKAMDLATPDKVPYWCLLSLEHIVTHGMKDEKQPRTIEELIEAASQYQCQPECQYYSPPTGVKGPYAFNCILLRYRLLNILDMKSGLTLEEVGRIYGCTRERIRQIQEQAMRRLRHTTRKNRLEIFRERVSDYKDLFYSKTSEKIA